MDNNVPDTIQNFGFFCVESAMIFLYRDTADNPTSDSDYVYNVLLGLVFDHKIDGERLHPVSGTNIATVIWEHKPEAAIEAAYTLISSTFDVPVIDQAVILDAKSGDQIDSISIKSVIDNIVAKEHVEEISRLMRNPKTKPTIH